MSTASGLEREIACPASAVLSPTVQESGEDAERGNELHTFCRSVIAGTPRAIALAAIERAEWRETAEQIDFNVLCGGLVDVRAEVAYRLNIETDEAHELGQNLARRYPPRSANDVDGTNDFEGRRPLNGRIVVTDIKTGFQLVTRCKRNPQLMFHARVLMLIHNVDEVEARIAYIGVGGEISFDTHTFTRFELDSFGDMLVERRSRIARANDRMRTENRVEVNAGDWCTYCSAKVVCPKYTALARSMTSELRAVHGEWGTLTMEQKAAATLLAYEARDLAEMIIASMKELARENPIDLGNGKQLRETSSGVKMVNAPQASRRRRVA